MHRFIIILLFVFITICRIFAQPAEKMILTENDSGFSDTINFTIGSVSDALKIIWNSILKVQVDTNLIYNTALAAYEFRNWDKAISYLSVLHGYNYSVNASHLLFTAYLET